MTQALVNADYSAVTTIGDLTSPLVTTVDLFDRHFVENSGSAIDLFIVNCTELNKLWAGEADLSPEFGRVLLLGYVSATESFFRTIIRSIINADESARAGVHSLVVPFGAVLYHRKEMLVEALMEGYSFASAKDIRNAISKLLGITSTKAVDDLLNEFDKICHLRHCCVHRFGKLGTQNGIVLGLAEHQVALEKPLKLTKDKLEDIASWLMSFVKAINNFIFRTILDRTADQNGSFSLDWKWTYSRDQAKFERIYNIFKTDRDSVPSPAPKVIYLKFKAVRGPK